METLLRELLVLSKDTASLLYESENKLRTAKSMIIAGIDEAGRGPLAGPVVSAAVILPSNPVIQGINDSKKLSPPKREYLFEQILNISLATGIGIRSNAYIDKNGIMKATFASMRTAIRMLSLKGFKPDLILVDGFKIPGLDIPQEAVVKGDSTMASVACASIIAKVVRDRIMVKYDQLYPDYAFSRHKGYCTRLHWKTALVKGLCPIHRKSFTFPAPKTQQPLLSG